MKFTLLAIAFFAVSCSHHPSRVPSGRYNETKPDIYKVGEIKTSLLSAEKFQAEYGTVWRLMNGEVLEDNSEFEYMTGLSKIPDASGKFLRMLNNGKATDKNDPEANRLMGSEQMDEFKAHSHRYNGIKSFYFGKATGEKASRAQGGESGSLGPTETIGGAESRPKNIAVNFFVKVASCPANEPNCL